jgi:predicted nucleotide-binding protein
MEDRKPAVFVGSSTEKLDVAEKLIMFLDDFAEVTCWVDVFQPGISALNSLVNIKDKFSFAIFIMTADDQLISRDANYNVPRDNILFELGLFIGSIGNERVFVICDKNVETKILSDYSGITYINYNLERKDQNITAALRPCYVQIKEAMKNVIAKSTHKKNMAQQVNASSLNPESIAFGLEKVFSSYEEAEPEILNELRNSYGLVRMFLQIGTKNIFVKGSLYGFIEQASKRGVELQILHASSESPYFEKERLLSMGKDPEEILSTLKIVNISLEQLSKKTSLRERTHSWPFIWRIYGFEKRLYLMPYFAEKNATEKSPVLVFANQRNSLYSTFVTYFDFLWKQSADKKQLLSDIITPSSKAGSALLLNWNGYHVFGIMKREVDADQDFIRVSGIGGKRIDYHESLVTCAIREGNEETDNSIDKLIQVGNTKHIDVHGTSKEICIIGESTVPYLIIEQHKNVSGDANHHEIYYLTVYKASLKKKPYPSNEIAALLFVNDRQLALVKKRCTLDEVINEGAIIETQVGINIDMCKIIKPHGLFLYALTSSNALS